MFLRFRRYRFRRFFSVLFATGFALCLCLAAVPPFQGAVQATDPQSLVQSGVDDYQVGDYWGAIATWETALGVIGPGQLAHQTIVLENLARAHLQVGDFSEAIAYWGKAAENHEQLGNLQALGRARTEAAQAHSRLGQHRRAMALLCGEDIDDCQAASAVSIARALSDVNGEVAALGSLAEAHRLVGNYDTAIDLLQQALAILKTDSQLPETRVLSYRASLFSSLGNSYSALGQVSRRRGQAATQRGDTSDGRRLAAQAAAQNQQAIDYLLQSDLAAQRTHQVLIQVRAQLALIPLYQQTKQLVAATQAQQRAQQLVMSLPDSQDKAFAIIALAGTLEPADALAQPSQQCPAVAIFDQQTQLLEAAVTIAQTIQNPRAESFALGQLGHLSERCEDYARALSLTQAARLAADQDRAAQDSLYLWVWQQARILRAQGKTTAATATYRRALEVLEPIRSDILTANRELQFDFRDRVEPIYREYAALKLAEISPSKPVESARGSSVDSALVALDSLKLAELQNYFANDCIITPVATRVDVVSEQSATAVISTVIFPDRTAVIASFPNGQRQLEWINLDSTQLTTAVNDLRRALEEPYLQVTFRAPAQQLYRQLIGPFEASLQALQIETLVFVHDGVLRSVPMAALYNGEQFLIEKFAIATTPSLTLTDPNASDPSTLSALILGLSEPSRVEDLFYPPLNKVEDELSAVEQRFANSRVLKNEDFSEPKMRTALQENDYQVLHIATHGNFGAEPKDNYIVTGQKIDGQVNKALTISDLDALIRSVSSVDREPIDLLVLTACETAVGDDRATLGLAGVAVRAGVRSAIASLWTVDDAATADLITRFYHYLLDEKLGKAEAMRAAQLEVIALGGFTQHPYFWAPFILIGNWL
ncbi:MAG: CHAT domain-containing protein [Cyanobacteria bacterium J06632_22]